jgi:hypothetical protein
MEVDQQANRIAAESQVRKQLCLVYRRGFRESLQFDEDSIFNEEVDAIPDVDLSSAIDDRYGHFDFDSESLQDQFLMKAHPVCALEKPGSQ